MSTLPLTDDGMPTVLSHSGRFVARHADGTEQELLVFRWRGERSLWLRVAHDGKQSDWEHVGRVDVEKRMVHVQAFGAPPEWEVLGRRVTKPRRYGTVVEVLSPHCRHCEDVLVRDQDVRRGRHAQCSR